MILSKSRYLLGLQCPKYLWLSVHESDRIPEVDKATQHRFDEGHAVGELAKQLFPQGIDIPDEDLAVNLKKTKELLPKRKPLFEAAFSTDHVYSRADILVPVQDKDGKDQWDILEVKSSTEVKDVYLHDVSFQKHCYEKAGLKIRKCLLLHINSEYVRKGDLDVKRLFAKADITDGVKEKQEGIQERITGMRKMLAFPRPPEHKIGPHCKDPYECPLNECWQHLPKHNVFTLYWAGKLAFKLYEQGIVENKDIPKHIHLNERQQIQVLCETSKKPHIDKEEIQKFLKTIKEPAHYFDFETFSVAIPPYDGLRPYQRVPFQFSLHIRKDGKTEHVSFLADGKGDPRPALIKAMKDAFLDEGSIIAYNASFEKGVIKELAEASPEDKPWLLSLNGRFVDLLTPFRSFHCYHPDQHGSASIKKVLPAHTKESYAGMGIAQGDDASLAFLDIMAGEMSEAEVKKARHDLERYCEQDTKAMTLLLDRLKEMTS